MEPFCSWRRVPRAGVDPICSASDAITLLSAVIHQPLRDETVVVLLDAERCGRSIVVVSGTEDTDAVVAVSECMAAVVNDSIPGGALVLATVRPGGGVLPDDVDHWLDASEVCETLGVELVEWFVIGGSADDVIIGCPRDLLGETPRW